MHQQTTTQHIPSLDGIRAVSIIIVMASHAGYIQVPGGFGVTVFFFLSGYLITTLLMAEYESTGTISIRRFFLRRILRLMPPLVITLAITYALTLGGVLPGGVTLAGAASQLLYFANYYSIFFATDQSIPAGTGILWSLAVEEHYYAVFPFFMAFALRRFNLGSICIILLTVCCAVLLWRFVLATKPGFHPDRTYYGTDTRVDSILFGCILAVGWPYLRRSIFPIKQRLLYCLVLVVCALTIAFTFLYREEMFRETLRYTLQGIALMPMFWEAVRSPDGALGIILNNKVMITLGKLSYTIYLSHLIIITLLRDVAGISSTWLIFASAAALSAFYALIIDKTVESYFRPLRVKLR